MKQNKQQFEKKEPQTPSNEEKIFYSTLEGKTIKYITDCFQNDKKLEAYMYSWALVEQVLIIKLIKFICQQFKIEPPNNLWKMNQVTINYFYFAISHDKTLYSNLEDGRKKRNRITHDLIKKHDDDLLNKEIQKALEHDFINIISPIFDRLSGKTAVPSLRLYSSGWNDGLARCIEIIKNK